MKLAQKSYLRLKNMLKRDKEPISPILLDEIKSDLFLVLNEYFDCSILDLNLEYKTDNNGIYDFEIYFKANSVKKINFF